MTEPTDVPVVPAATVMIVDDRPDLHVLMVRRTPRVVFGSGMWVFPGGRVDPADADSFHDLVDGLDDIEASADLGVPDDGLSYWVAAVRETFEESGVLLAHPEGEAAPVALDDPEVADRVAGLREALNQGERTFLDIVRSERLRLVLDDVHYVGRWITPVGPPRRFDARFFITHPPAHQEPSHDGGELIDWEWVRPVDALRGFAEGTFSLMSPTTRMLQSLALFDSADAVMGAARRHLPWERARAVFRNEGGYDLVMPGEPHYDEGIEDFERGWVRIRPTGAHR
jgi:8-oxo-dGTP pyrophosphatase MutT (NUDIX family)